MATKAKGNGKQTKETIQLTNEERLELFNLKLQRDLIQAQIDRAMGEVRAKEQALVDRINGRLHIDFNHYHVNLETGEGHFGPPPGMQQMQMMPAQPGVPAVHAVPPPPPEPSDPDAEPSTEG